MALRDPLGVVRELTVDGRRYGYYALEALVDAGILEDPTRLPFSIRVLLEAALRGIDGETITEEDVRRIAGWTPRPGVVEIPYRPARIVMQDFTGVPAVVDLAAMRDAMAELGGDPTRINPLSRVDLVIDHSVQVDRYATIKAFVENARREFERNRERYTFLKWGSQAFDNFGVVPPATGIIHQVNLEYLAKVVLTAEVDGTTVAFPDTLVGTDSHTTMINGLGVLGWGVGGIEAEAALLGQPIYMLLPEVIGVRLEGELPEGATATDLVLTITEMLRRYGVVGKFVEFFGPGARALSLADRATIANMAPEYGATMGFFPVDEETLRYLEFTGRDPELVALVEAYTKAQGLFHGADAPEATYTNVLTLDMSTVEPSIAGPRRPQDRIPLRRAKAAFVQALRDLSQGQAEARWEQDPAYLRWLEEGGSESTPVADADRWDGEGGGQRDFAARTQRRRDLYRHSRVEVELGDEIVHLGHGSVVIAAITSCTNTSNPSVMLGAGLLAKKAVDLGLDVPPYVKTSLAPGSRVVTGYLERSGLMPYLEALGFHLVGYGCTTCIGNSGPLRPEISEAIRANDLVVASVLSGNRNFEGRIHPDVRANYLASPPLVVAYALAGTVDIDFAREPVGYDRTGEPIYLQDIWPTAAEIREAIAAALDPELFRSTYATILEGDEQWRAIPAATGERYAWEPNSTYIRRPPFFEGISREVPPIQPIVGARVLAYLGDSVTTDHISPAGAIPANSPAGRWLQEQGVQPQDFNTYGSRRGNHEVMMRGTFANIRIRNKLVPGVEGGYTKHLPDGEQMSIYDAAMRYKEEGVPLIVLAGKEYGTGSSRDWAAKGTALLGVRAVIAESFERIHRSNLVGMGVLPLQFVEGNAESLGLDGTEVYEVVGLGDELQPRQQLEVVARRDDGSEVRFPVLVRLDSSVEVTYYRNGGILHTVLRQLA